jgi:hypothetical protein
LSVTLSACPRRRLVRLACFGLGHANQQCNILSGTTLMVPEASQSHIACICVVKTVAVSSLSSHGHHNPQVLVLYILGHRDEVQDYFLSFSSLKLLKFNF